jgi:Kef-type K+ transport system membrane component KefB
VQIEPIRNFFAALFLASIGMLIHVHFLWSHVDILLASVILVIIIKTAIITAVVKGFGYNNKTSLLVRFCDGLLVLLLSRIPVVD